ncbi:MAG: LysR substrate-binding domain-containing protein [Methylobacterium frigidaeris]
MIDLRQLRQFIAVAEELHFHRAAARLNMSQPPLTAAIRRLEAEVGAELIRRGNRTVALTPAGRALLDEARRTVRQADRAVEAARDAAAGRCGTLRLVFVGSALYGRLPALIRRFRQTHPAVRLELREAPTARQVAWLRRGEADLAVAIPPLDEAGGLASAAFADDHLAVALPRGHRLAGEAVALPALAAEPFVLWPAAEGRGFHLHVTRTCAAAGFVPRVVQEAHQMHAVLSLVAVEAGVSIVPAAMSGFRAEEIAYAPLPGTRFGLSLLWVEDRLPPPAELFVRLAAGDTNP